MIIIGSSALRWHNIPFRQPKDRDVFATREELIVIHKGLDIQYVSQEIIDLIPNSCGNASPDAIYTIKLSHLAWDVHSVHSQWLKHYRDVQYLKKIGCKLIEPLFVALLAHWTNINGNKEFLSLEQSKKDFFTDFVVYKYPHDYLHYLLAYPKLPIYMFCHKEDNEVDIDKEKFDILPFELQVEFFRQEIGVIAVERWLVHEPIPLVTAWTNAVRKTITRLTKGWMSEFIVRNIEHFIKPNREDFSHLFNTLNIKETTMQELTNDQVGRVRGGHSYVGGMYWCHFSDNSYNEFVPVPGVNQIVGHSHYQHKGALQKKEGVNSENYNVDCIYSDNSRDENAHTPYGYQQSIFLILENGLPRQISYDEL